jgi:hypothetical protein
MAYIGSKPANKPVVASDLDPTVITGQTALATSPADTDEFLISDAGVLKRLDASLVGSPGITEADMWRLTTTIAGTNADITANLERVDDASFAKIGTGVTPSSGIFSFPSTGLWLIGTMASISFGNQADNAAVLYVKATINNSDYDDIAFITAGSNSSSNNSWFSVFQQQYLNVTNVSNVKVKFTTGSFDGSGSELRGDTANNRTAFSFIRLGDSQ